MKGPWVKLWRNVFADEKVSFCIRRYGHEAGIFWIGLLSQAEDGVLTMDEDIFADLIQIEEKRYHELRGVLLKRGLVVETDEGQLEIPNWDEYQLSESAERMREYRARKKATPEKDQHRGYEVLRNGDATVTEKLRVEVEGEVEGEEREEGAPIEAVALRAPPPPSEKGVSTRRKKDSLPEEQLPTFHAAKAAFEGNEKAQALMYQDRASTGREIKALKILVERAHKIAPDAPAEFLAAAMRRYRELCNTKLRGKAAWTPAGLATPWIWSLVLEGMQSEPTAEERALASVTAGLFARRVS